jgi:hypothetical protein
MNFYDCVALRFFSLAAGIAMGTAAQGDSQHVFSNFPYQCIFTAWLAQKWLLFQTKTEKPDYYLGSQT